jgi:sec-independent protein translocase protein TatB
MFDIGWGEFVVIGIVALIAIGPKELPGVLRTAGQWMGKLKRMANEFQGQFHEALREAEMTDLKKHADDLSSAVSDITRFDPTVSTYKEPGSVMTGTSVLEQSTITEAANAAPPNDLLAPSFPDVSVPLPDEIPPVSERDFAPVEPAPAALDPAKEANEPVQRPAGGGA